MGIFYLEEHISCQYYAKYIKEGFTLHTLKKGESIKEELQQDCILFVIKGELHIFYNEFEILLPAEKMICFRRQGVCRLYCMEGCTLIIAQFEHSVLACDKLFLTELFASNMQIPHKLNPLTICRELIMFLDLVSIYLEDGANCIHLHEIKIRELFWLLRFYYTREKLASFFYPIHGNDRAFRNLVLQNYRGSMTVKVLAERCSLSLPSFKRKFVEEFGEPAGKWLQHQIDGIIRYRLSDMDSPLADIAEELGFASLSHFHQYCKRRLGSAPGEWRRLLKGHRDNFLRSPIAILNQTTKKYSQ